jgi:hypothetical protein
LTEVYDRIEHEEVMFLLGVQLDMVSAPILQE